MQRMAAIQMCSTHIVEDNLMVAQRLIAQAANHQATLVVLPESFAAMAKQPQDNLLIQERFGFGPIQAFLSQAAKRHGIWILGGTIPLATDDANKVSASSLLYAPTGNVVARYDKIHLFDVTLSATEIYRESDLIQAGNDLICVETPFAKLGVGVCYDIRFPEMFRALFKQGMTLLAIPAAFTAKTGEAHWEVLLRSRAIENFGYVIAAAQVGTHANGRKTYGHSMIIGPWGNIIAQSGSEGEDVIFAEIDLGEVGRIRRVFNP